jgi:hypothetical protein
MICGKVEMFIPQFHFLLFTFRFCFFLAAKNYLRVVKQQTCKLAGVKAKKSSE